MKNIIERIVVITWIICSLVYCVVMFRGDNAKAMFVLTVAMLPATIVFLCSFWGARKR